WAGNPRAMIGHSVGEYVAACLAGVLSLKDGLALVAARGRLMQKMPRGAMLAVALAEEHLRPLLGDQICVAAVNGPSMCVISGPLARIEEQEREFGKDGVASWRLETSHAYHSAMMEPVVKPFAARIREVKLNPPRIPFISNVTGSWISESEARDPDYWAAHLRHTVRFSDGLANSLKE